MSSALEAGGCVPRSALGGLANVWESGPAGWKRGRRSSGGLPAEEWPWSLLVALLPHPHSWGAQGAASAGAGGPKAQGGLRTGSLCFPGAGLAKPVSISESSWGGGIGSQGEQCFGGTLGGAAAVGRPGEMACGPLWRHLVSRLDVALQCGALWFGGGKQQACARDPALMLHSSPTCSRGVTEGHSPLSQPQAFGLLEANAQSGSFCPFPGHALGKRGCRPESGKQNRGRRGRPGSSAARTPGQVWGALQQEGPCWPLRLDHAWSGGGAGAVRLAWRQSGVSSLCLGPGLTKRGPATGSGVASSWSGVCLDSSIRSLRPKSPSTSLLLAGGWGWTAPSGAGFLVGTGIKGFFKKKIA